MRLFSRSSAPRRHLLAGVPALAAVYLLTLISVTGCAQDVGDIDRTQPDKIEKSIFEGNEEWYFHQTVIDTTPAGKSSASMDDSGRFKRGEQRPVWTGMAGGLKRITWDIEKDVLYARATSAPVEGVTEGKDGEKHEEKGIVAAFPIKSHFDVQRRYNTSTGEPTNVIVENRSDRPWHKREYMRVDWSQNLVSTLGSIGFGRGQMTPKRAAKHTRAMPQSSDEFNPDRTRISEDYVDTVTEYIYDPDLYACMSTFGADSIWRCEGVTARVRNSFRKVPEEQDYAPLQYRDDVPLTEKGSSDPIETTRTIDGGQFVEAKCTDAVVEKNRKELQRERGEACSDASFDLYDRFGFIRMNSATWSEDRHTYESGRRQYAARQNIWETAYDDEGKRLPLAEREPEPIVYHMNVGFPRDMMDVAERVEREWNTAFLEAVRLAKGYDSNQKVVDELKKSGHQKGQMFVVEKNSCHPGPLLDWLKDRGGKRNKDRKSPRRIVEDYIADASGASKADKLWSLPIEQRRRLCAEMEWATENRKSRDARFTWERFGDLRYSFFNWINDFNTMGWTGVVYSSMDPKTGETISASANFAGRSVGPYATGIADTVQYLNGDLDYEDVVDGDHVRRQMESKRRRQGLKPQDAFRPNRKSPQLSAFERGKHPDLVDSVDEELSTTAEDLGVPPQVIHREANRAIEASAKADAVDGDLMKWLEKPEIKERMMSNPMLHKTVEASAVELHGKSAAEDPDAIHQAYLDMMAPMLRQKRIEQQERMLRKNHVLSARAGRQMADNIAIMMGASDHFEGMSHEKLTDYAREVLFYSTMVHELGHAMGLEHNFAASMDPLNYERAYWKLERMKYGCKNSNAPECKDGKLTDEEALTGGPKLAEEVYEQNDTPYVNQAEQQAASVMDYMPVLADTPGLGLYDQAAINFAYARHVQQWKSDVKLPRNFRRKLRRTHHDRLPALFGDPDSIHAGSCTGGINAKCMKRGIDTILDGREWISIDEAKENYRKVIEHNTNLISKGKNGTPKIDRTVDYRYCTNGREGSYLGCEVHDWGANQVEMLSYQFDRFRLLQPFYRHRGSSISPQNGVIRRFAGRLMRTLGRADTPFRYYSFYKQLDYNVGSFTEDLEAAARMGLNFYGEIMSTPEPTKYCKYEKGDLSSEHNLDGQARDVEGVYIPSDIYLRDRSMSACDESLRVERGEGQFFPFDWSDEYNYRVNRVGTYIDKVFATGRLFSLDANLTFSQFITDQRAANISYWTEFPDQLYKFVHGVFLGDYSEFGGGVDPKTGKYHAWKMVETFDGEENGAQGPNPGDPMPSNLKRIYDPTSFDIRMRILVNAAAEYSSWEDKKTDFDEYLVVAASEKERQALPEDLPEEATATFVHPVSRRKYTAVQAADGKSITYDLVEWANDIESKLETAKNNDATERAEDLRDALENVVAKLNLIRRVRAELSPEG